MYKKALETGKDLVTSVRGCLEPSACRPGVTLDGSRAHLPFCKFDTVRNRTLALVWQVGSKK
jgi:hypothetical protein